MPAAAWATADQIKFLESCLSDFQSAQQTKKTTEFWAIVNRDFFDRWPSPEAEEPEATVPRKPKTKKSQAPAKPKKAEWSSQEEWIALRKRQIQNWYNNRCQNKKPARSSTHEVEETDGGRISSEQNLYSRKYYDTRVKHMADPLLLGEPENRHLAIRNRCIANAWKNETEDIKAEIAQMREAEIQAKEDAKNAADEPPTPETCAATLADMPERLKAFLETQAKRTGWVFTLLTGGVDPTTKLLRTFAIHIGEDQFGNNFRIANRNYKCDVYEPFRLFANNVCFPEALDDAPKSSSSTEQATQANEKRETPSAEAAQHMPVPDSSPTTVEQPPPQYPVPDIGSTLGVGHLQAQLSLPGTTPTLALAQQIPPPDIGPTSAFTSGLPQPQYIFPDTRSTALKAVKTFAIATGVVAVGGMVLTWDVKEGMEVQDASSFSKATASVSVVSVFAALEDWVPLERASERATLLLPYTLSSTGREGPSRLRGVVSQLEETLQADDGAHWTLGTCIWCVIGAESKLSLPKSLTSSVPVNVVIFFSYEVERQHGDEDD
ncbi:hypothetical protein NLJ89_g3091 [Agrocybe chaxingu]|uniref:Uncharacterized protein n=1 Tax=Agrocybe chaxingu TaxID=84603 RepID=A0A9W8MX59_9AGAR|nr:hypothetical protein NLJ89_g3091 [Agrocybe chaxingu]